jgi:hypothetical protein
MTMFALLSWIVVGAVLGAILAARWKLRGLTLAWGFAVGGVGGFVGGLIGRMTLPWGRLADGLALLTAMGAGVLAMVIVRGRVGNEQSGSG